MNTLKCHLWNSIQLATLTYNMYACIPFRLLFSLFCWFVRCFGRSFSSFIYCLALRSFEYCCWWWWWWWRRRWRRCRLRIHSEFHLAFWRACVYSSSSITSTRYNITKRVTCVNFLNQFPSLMLENCGGGSGRNSGGGGGCKTSETWHRLKLKSSNQINWLEISPFKLFGWLLTVKSTHMPPPPPTHTQKTISVRKLSQHPQRIMCIREPKRKRNRINRVKAIVYTRRHFVHKYKRMHAHNSSFWSSHPSIHAPMPIILLRIRLLSPWPMLLLAVAAVAAASWTLK